jgi:hypothetical protein
MSFKCFRFISNVNFVLNTNQRPFVFSKKGGKCYATPKREGLIPRALFLGEMRNISPVSFEL